jgi:hypothetical protein
MDTMTGSAPAAAGRRTGPARRVGAVAVALATLLLSAAWPAGAASPAPSTGGAPADAVAVTATFSCALSAPGKETSTAVGGRLEGQMVGCYHKASDPRVSGTTVTRVDAESYSKAKHMGPYMIQETLTGPDGTWVGRGFGFIETGDNAHVVTVYAGTGAYDGWTYIMTTDITADGAGAIRGVIYHGAPPVDFPMVPAPTPAPSPAP